MRETRVRAAGKEWVIPAEPSVDVILRFRDWIAEQVGDPFEGLDVLVGYLPKEEMVAFIKQGRSLREQLKCFSLRCELAQNYLHTEIGGLKFTELILRDAYPDMTDKEVQAVTIAYGERLAAMSESEGNGQSPVSPGENKLISELIEADFDREAIAILDKGLLARRPT